MKALTLKFIKENQSYLLPILFFYIFAIYRIFLYSKIDNHLFFNQHVGNYYIDWFFKYITHFGDGFFLIFIVLLWIFKNIRQALILLTSYVIAGGLTSILKNYIFDEGRPHFIFGYYYPHIHVKYVEGVELLALNSFPSGHSTTAFVLFTFIAIQVKYHWQKFLLSIIASLVVFSRVYLSQHWLNDIFVGSLIGLILTWIIYLIFEKYRILNQLNKSILQ